MARRLLIRDAGRVAAPARGAARKLILCDSTFVWSCLSATLSAVALAAVTARRRNRRRPHRRRRQPAAQAPPRARRSAAADAGAAGRPRQAAGGEPGRSRRDDEAARASRRCGPGATRAPISPTPPTTTKRRPIPYPKLPELMVLKNGTKVTTKAQWETRRKELLEEFEREVVGRVPKDVPKVDVDGRGDGEHLGRRRPGRRPPRDRPAGQQRRARHQGGDGADRRHAGQGRQAGAGDDHVPRRPAARPAGIAGARLLRPAGAASGAG